MKSDKNVAYHKSVYVADQKSLLSKARSTSKAAAIWKPIVFTLTLRPAFPVWSAGVIGVFGGGGGFNPGSVIFKFLQSPLISQSETQNPAVMLSTFA